MLFISVFFDYDVISDGILLCFGDMLFYFVFLILNLIFSYVIIKVGINLND